MEDPTVTDFRATWTCVPAGSWRVIKGRKIHVSSIIGTDMWSIKKKYKIANAKKCVSSLSEARHMYHHMLKLQ
jgi:hypothetical protein